jgi:hypothetical protein
MDPWARRDPGILISFCGGECRITAWLSGSCENQHDVGTAVPGRGLRQPWGQAIRLGSEHLPDRSRGRYMRQVPGTVTETQFNLIRHCSPGIGSTHRLVPTGEESE